MRLITHTALAGLLATAAALNTTAFAAPALIVRPVVGHPKIPTTVSGTGFTPNEAVDVYFDTTEVFLAFTNASGVFAAHGFTVPANALPGTHWITAVGRKNGDGLQTSFNVRTDWNEFGFDSQHRSRNPYENVIDGSNAGTLDVAWSYATGGPIWGQPAVYGNVIYIGSGDDKLYALTTKGVLKWTATTGGAIESTPSVEGGKVYISSTDGKVYAFDLTGAPKWSAATGGSVTSSPVVVGNSVYVGSHDDRVYAFDATTGATLWSTLTGAVVELSTPSVVNGIVYIGSTDNNLYALNASTGAVLWTVTTGGFVYGTAAISNGVAYFSSFDDKVYAVNANTGGPLWTYNMSNVSNMTPSIVNDTVFVGAFNRNVYALDASSGALKWSAALDGQVFLGSMSIADGVGYVGCGCGTVYGLDLKTGARLWSADTRAAVYGGPTVVNGVVYAGSTDGSLYAYALDGGNNAAYKSRQPPSYASLHPDLRLKSVK